MQSGMRTDTNPTLADKLAAAIADGILNGRLPPGERLDEVGLAEQHGVSRTPVREASRQLAMSGPDRHAPAQGRDRVQGDARGVSKACSWQWPRWKRPAPGWRREHDADRTAAPAGAARSDGCARRGWGDRGLFGRQRRLFAIYAGAHNAPLAEYAMNLRRRVGPYRRAQFRVDGRLLRSNQEHDTVVRAIVSGDAAGAHAAMIHHVSLVEDAFEAFAAINAA